MKNTVVGVFSLEKKEHRVPEVDRMASTHLQPLSPFHPLFVFHLPRSFLTCELPSLCSEESLPVTERRL